MFFREAPLLIDHHGQSVTHLNMGLDPPFGADCPLASPLVDLVKPRIIFSSNIPQKVRDCVSERRLFLGGSKSRLVDLASDMGELEFVLELNTLLMRNRLLTPTDLVRKKLVFVAKKKAHSKKTSRALQGFTGVWRTVLEMADSSEVFVVLWKVKLDCLLIDLANVSDITIELKHDQLYESLLRDVELINITKTYIRHKLLLELKNNSNITSDISDANTILQDLPVNDSLPLMREFYNQLEEFDNTLADITLDTNTSIPFFEKQLIYEDFPEFDVSDEDMKLLHSDDSGRCTVDEDEDFQLSDGQYSNILLPAVPRQSIDTPKTAETSPPTPNKNDLLRNELVPEEPDTSIPRKTILRPQPRTPVRGKKILHSSPREEKEAKTRPISVPPEASPKVTDVPDLKKRPSLSTLQQPSLQKKSSTSSFAMISTDENYGLEYAFRDKSPTVPSYIKQDKKFKFIKVGKVQKFVNLFEEQAPASTPTSRYTSRTGSPLRGSKLR